MRDHLIERFTRGAPPVGLRGHLEASVTSLLALVVVTVAIAALKSIGPVISLGVLYVFAVLPVALAYGLVYAIAVSIGGMLLFNFFFLSPVHTFTLEDSRNWFALAVYVFTAVVVSELAARARRRANEAEQREAETALLAEIATSLLQGGDVAGRIDWTGERVAAGPRRPHRSCWTATGRKRRTRRRSSCEQAEGGWARSSWSRAASRTWRLASACCPHWRRCWPSRSTASGWRAAPSRPRRCGSRTRSRRPCCAPSAMTCARP